MHSSTLFLLAAVISSTYGYHILCVFPVPSKSHNHLAKGIVDSLLDAGHEVTWGTPYPDKTTRKNLKQIDLSATQDLGISLDMSEDRNRHAGPQLVKDFARNISTVTLQSRQLQETVARVQFDAVVTEWFFSDVDAGYAAVQQVPWVLLSGMNMHPHLEMLVDDVRSVPTIPLLFNDFPVPMSLWERAVNCFVFLVMTASNWLDQSSNEEFYKANFGPIAEARGLTLPPYSAALHNVSIVLVNSDPAIDTPRSVPPNVVSIAGYHIEENPAPLPKDLQTILDSSTKGFVYFSMGSVLKSSTFPEKTIRELLQVLGDLPYTVLWKFEKELSGVPKNVHVRAWFPQASVLAHPNIKVFITHGGLLSTLEAANAGVPLLAVPVFGDQPGNAARSVRNGVARKVDFSYDMAQPLKKELNAMLNNDSYQKRAKYISKLFRKRPVAPSKLVSHYIEVAIESKGAYHLRSPSKLYAWYERWLLDLLAILTIALYLIVKILKAVFRAMVREKGSADKKQKRS